MLRIPVNPIDVQDQYLIELLAGSAFHICVTGS